MTSIKLLFDYSFVEPVWGPRVCKVHETLFSKVTKVWINLTYLLYCRWCSHDKLKELIDERPFERFTYSNNYIATSFILPFIESSLTNVLFIVYQLLKIQWYTTHHYNQLFDGLSHVFMSWIYDTSTKRPAV